jgi:hypothetical protein
MGDIEALDCRASKIARALCKRCHDAFHNAAGGAVRMAIGPFFSNTNEVREFPASSEYPVAA